LADQTIVDRLRSRLADQRGGMIIEVVVAAALLLLVAGAILRNLDQATADSGQQRLQTIAADLAQTELEALRTLRFDQLVDLNQTETVRVGDPGLPEEQRQSFEVERQGTWALEGDPTGAGCQTSARSPEALRVSVTVRWPGMQRRPVRLDTLIATPAGSQSQRGAYVVQVTDADSAGVADLPVTLAGESGGTLTRTASTDSNGCVRFSEMPEGDYRVQFSRSGWLAPDGTTVVDDPVDVVADQTRSKAYDYDQGGYVLVQPYTDQDSAVETWGASFTASALPADVGVRIAPPAIETTSPLLFPQTTYGVYADGCQASRPPDGQGGTAAVNRGETTVTRLRVPRMTIAAEYVHRDWTNHRLLVQTPCGDSVSPIAGTLSSPYGDGARDYRRWTSTSIPGAYGTTYLACFVVQTDTAGLAWRFEKRENLTNTNVSGTSHKLSDMRTADSDGPVFARTYTTARTAEQVMEDCLAV